MLQEKFPTEIAIARGDRICPNGDSVRSDEEGLFCWLYAQRVPYPASVETVAALEEAAAQPKSEGKKKGKSGKTESPMPADLPTELGGAEGGGDGN